jgi:hypothetical protein
MEPLLRKTLEEKDHAEQEPTRNENCVSVGVCQQKEENAPKMSGQVHVERAI